MPKKGYHQTPEHRMKNWMRGRIRELHPRWIGRTIDRDGYIYMYRPDYPRNNHGYVREHRLIYEEYHRCCILPWIDIHHINGNRQDNRVENLQLLTKYQHGKLEFTRYGNQYTQRVSI